jgi:hypothetical protein
MNEYYPIVISTIAILLAAFSLGWNVYRDLLLKSRLRVSFLFVDIIGGGLPNPIPKISIAALNLGPSPIKLDMIHCQTSSLFRRLFRKVQHGIIINPDTDMSSPLPCKLEVGETATFFFNNDAPFIKDDFTHIGVRDSFGRIHWAPKKYMRLARKQIKEAAEQGHTR